MGNLEFDGRVAIVTGASSGIGAAVALELSLQGASVWAAGRDETRLNRVVADCTGSGSIQAITVDLRQESSIKELVSRVLESEGKVNILVNCAGIAELGQIDSISREDWDEAFAVNVTAPFLLVKHLLGALEASNGVVVNVASIAGRLRSATLGAQYSSSKAALIGLTRHLAGELGPRGIRVCATCPSQTYTPMLEAALGPGDEERLVERNPSRRLSTAQEQATVIAFLASDGASYMNGSIVDVNGGVL